MESQLELEQCCCDCDYELIQDIQGRMILHWNYRNLREIPNEVLNYGEHIEEIYLKRNCLEKLPPNIGKLCNLTNLYLVGNQLEELPAEIGNLKCLKVLDLSQNYIKRLPGTVGDLHLLESLLITYNQLEEIPKCLKHLHRLKQLEVSGNRIYSIPSDVVEGLQSLEEFGIDRNPISSIPRNICLLQNLRYFSACRCNLLLLPSLPFHSLFNNSRTDSRLSKAHSNAGALNSNRNLQFLFDGNPRLNYIPYWILQLLGTNVECFGCGLDPGESDNGGPNPFYPHETAASQANTQLLLYTYWSGVNRPKIKLNFKGKRRTLHFDEDIVKLHHHHNCNGNVEGAAMEKVIVASLLELCLRQVHQLGLLDNTKDQNKYTNCKPVVEPLIVPQRADGNSLINIREDIEKKKNEAIEKADFPKSVSNDPSNSFNAVLPSSSQSSSSGSAKMLLKSGERHNELCAQHAKTIKGQMSHNYHETETVSASAAKGNTSNQPRIEDKDISSFILPVNLRKILMAGPVARCFECLKPIFTESWPIVFHIPVWVFDENIRERMRMRGMGENDIRGDWDDMHDGKLSIGCTHFCSDGCVTRFHTGTQFSSNLMMNDLRCIVENELQWTSE